MLETMSSKLKLLGIEPAIKTGFNKASPSDLITIETLVSSALPKDYKLFLENYGASRFTNWVFFVRSDKTSTSMNNITKSQIGSFLGASVTGRLSIVEHYKRYVDRIPEHFLPITSESGNFICISLSPDTNEYGKIYHWDHNLEWDEDEYVAQHKKRMPREAKFSNMTLVADSFTDLIDILEIDPENS